MTKEADKCLQRPNIGGKWDHNGHVGRLIELTPLHVSSDHSSSERIAGCSLQAATLLLSFFFTLLCTSWPTRPTSLPRFVRTKQPHRRLSARARPASGQQGRPRVDGKPYTRVSAKEREDRKRRLPTYTRLLRNHAPWRKMKQNSAGGNPRCNNFRMGSNGNKTHLRSVPCSVQLNGIEGAQCRDSSLLPPLWYAVILSLP